MEEKKESYYICAELELSHFTWTKKKMINRKTLMTKID